MFQTRLKELYPPLNSVTDGCYSTAIELSTVSKVQCIINKLEVASNYNILVLQDCVDCAFVCLKCIMYGGSCFTLTGVIVGLAVGFST